MEGISFRETACGLSDSPSHGSQLRCGVALENCPLLSSFSILVFPPFLSSPPIPVHSAGQHIFLPYHQEIASDRGSVASPLSNVHPILITMSNQWSSGQTEERASGRPVQNPICPKKTSCKNVGLPSRTPDWEIDGQGGRRSEGAKGP